MSTRRFVIPFTNWEDPDNWGPPRLSPRAVDIVWFQYQEEIISMTLKSPPPKERETVDWKREGF